MIVIVTAGRHYRGAGLVQALDKLETEHPQFSLYVGDATGGDAIARRWARARSCRLFGDQEDGMLWRLFPAAWSTLGRGAGPKRNQAMVDFALAQVRLGQVRLSGHAMRVICLAAPGGRGTADCVRRCREAGFEVVEVTT